MITGEGWWDGVLRKQRDPAVVVQGITLGN
jgi:hypothetical protein